MQKSLQCLLVVIGALLFAAPAMAWDPFDDPRTWDSNEDEADTGDAWFEDDSDEEVKEAELDEYVVKGTDVYIICIYGDRDNGSVPQKCTYMEGKLRRMYPRSKVVREDNPSQQRMEELQRRVGKDIGVVIVVTHSTSHGPGQGWDVWDCPLQPEDIADIFDDKWVIWNGCYSADICREADNILPVQCESEGLPTGDNTWRRMVRCLERTAGTSQNRDDICEEVFGRRWK